MLKQLKMMIYKMDGVCRAKNNFGYEELKKRDIAGNIWIEHSKRYITHITEHL